MFSPYYDGSTETTVVWAKCLVLRKIQQRVVLNRKNGVVNKMGPSSLLKEGSENNNYTHSGRLEAA